MQASRLVSPAATPQSPPRVLSLTQLDKVNRDMLVALTWLHSRPLLPATLERALQATLDAFPTLAGRLIQNPTQQNQNENDPFPIALSYPHSAAFQTATFTRDDGSKVSSTIIDLLQRNESITSHLVASSDFPLTPHEALARSCPLLSILYSAVPDVGLYGVTICVSHLIADGHTVGAFMREFTLAYQRLVGSLDSQNTLALPVEEGATIYSLMESLASSHPCPSSSTTAAYKRVDPEFFTRPVTAATPSTIPQSKNTTRAFHIPVKHLKYLKHTYMQHITSHQTTDKVPFISTDDTLCALIWSIVTDIRGCASRPTSMHRPINLRENLLSYLHKHSPKHHYQHDLPMNALINMNTARQANEMDPWLLALKLRKTILTLDWKAELSYLAHHEHASLFYSGHVEDCDVGMSSWTKFGFAKMGFDQKTLVGLDSLYGLGEGYPGVGQIVGVFPRRVCGCGKWIFGNHPGENNEAEDEDCCVRVQICLSEDQMCLFEKAVHDRILNLFES